MGELAGAGDGLGSNRGMVVKTLVGDAKVVGSLSGDPVGISRCGGASRWRCEGRWFDGSRVVSSVGGRSWEGLSLKRQGACVVMDGSGDDEGEDEANDE